MSEQQPTGDDVEGHAYKRTFVEDEQAGDDVEGHGFRLRVAEDGRGETDDVEGHHLKWMYADDQAGADAQHYKGRTYAEPDDTDDVSGHLSGALGTQKRDDGH